MKSVGKPVPVSANKINELKPIIIPIPTLIPNPNINTVSLVVNEFLTSTVSLAINESLSKHIATHEITSSHPPVK